MYIGPSNYDNFQINNTTSKVILCDHLGGFDQNLKSPMLDRLTSQSDGRTLIVESEYIFDQRVKKNYLNFDFCYNVNLWETGNFVNSFTNYTEHPELTFSNFICSFNGTPHVSRRLLVSILKRFGYFNTNYCSKNFSYSTNVLDGHVTDYVDDNSFYRKFFISPLSEEFFQKINSFGHVRYDHKNNIYNLENIITKSFLHIVSETIATSYYPFVTEKFLYSVVTRGLFLAYAHPGWHDHLEKYYGFKRYTKLFDYRFDAIENPVERLIELMSIISKFSKLSSDDWRDLYLLQQDEIEYNYNHYFSGDYLKHLKQYE